MNLTDTHCHLDLQAFEPDRELVIERAQRAGLVRMLVPALDLASSRRILLLLAGQPDIFAAVGVHPTEAGSMEDNAFPEVRTLAADEKVVAIGEIGLDYFWIADEAARVLQRSMLKKQLELARDVGLPVIIHLRESGDAQGGPCATHLLEILRDWIADLRVTGHPLKDRPGVLHSFAGTLEAAWEAIALGFYIGVTGPVTYKNADARRQVIAGLPLDRLLLETDSPFLAPVPHRGARNEPAYVVHIADRIADTQSRTESEVARVTTANAARLFAWGDID